MTRPTCTVADCGRPHYGRGYCRPHHARWARHGDPQTAVAIAGRTAGEVTYWSALRRVRSARGPARAQRCTECGSPAASWSYDGADPDERTDPTHGYRYSLDPSRYRPRCRSCHLRATSAVRPARAAVAIDVERAARLYRAGASARGIGALLRTSPGAVRGALRAHGVVLRPGARQSAPSRSATAAQDRTPSQRTRHIQDPSLDDTEHGTSDPALTNTSTSHPAEHPTQDHQTRTKSNNQRSTRQDEEQEHKQVQVRSGPMHHDPTVGSASPDGPAEPKESRSC